MMSTPSPEKQSILGPQAVAVYCGSSLGKQKAFRNAALSVGIALAESKRPLVYGGGFQGIMGLVAESVISRGGQVTGVVPYAIRAAGGERDKLNGSLSLVSLDIARNRVETVVVNSMHERKVEMAQRAAGFLGLPGGFGTFEEVLEVTTWTQIGIHHKPVVLLNVLSFWDPLRLLVQNSVREGFIQPGNELIIFVDGPPDHLEHETFDWGTAALHALDNWSGISNTVKPVFDWSKRAGGEIVESKLESS